MKTRGRKDIRRGIKGPRKLRGKLPANADRVREPVGLPRLPTWRSRKTGSPFATGADPLSNRSMLDAADEAGEAFEKALGAFLGEWEEKHGPLTVELDRAAQELNSRRASRYRRAADVLADMPPPEIARKLRIDVAKKTSIAPPFSDHMFADALSLSLHSIAARKILREPSCIEKAQRTLERWLEKHRPAPEPFVEWQRILTGTPQEIAAVALSMTEEATRLRSSSPLACLITPKERAGVYAVFGKTTSEAKPKTFARILAQATKTFGSEDAAEAWLNSPVMSLEMKRPIDLLATTEGAQQVETALGRIEYGTYS